jgi:hypothetical protein
MRADTSALTTALGAMLRGVRQPANGIYLVSATSIDSSARARGARQSAAWLRSAQQHFGLTGICGSPSWHCPATQHGLYLALGTIAPYRADTVVVVVGARFVTTPVSARVGERIQREWQIGLFRTDTIREPRGIVKGHRYRVYLVPDPRGWRALPWSDALPESHPFGLQPGDGSAGV